jgi:F0F1-type ATP synthase assembly protein I
VQQHWKGVGTYGTVGLELGLSVLVGVLGGQWLDTRLGTEPWLMVAGLVLGAVAGFRTLWRALAKANRALEREEQRERENRRKYLDRDDGE